MKWLSNGGTESIVQDIQLCISKSFAEMIASIEDPLISKELRRLGAEFVGGFYSKSFDDPRFVKAMQSKSRGFEILRGEIQRRKNMKTKPSDLLQQLLDYKDEKEVPVKEQAILENVFFLVTASVDR